MKILELYNKLPKEVKVFFEYILPAAILTALIDYLGVLEFENEFVLMAVNVALIFLRKVPQRLEAFKK